MKTKNEMPWCIHGRRVHFIKEIVYTSLKGDMDVILDNTEDGDLDIVFSEDSFSTEIEALLELKEREESDLKFTDNRIEELRDLEEKTKEETCQTT